MKNIYNSVFILFILLLTSCEKYLDVNFDPRNPQVAQGFAILPPIFHRWQGESLLIPDT